MAHFLTAPAEEYHKGGFVMCFLQKLHRDKQSDAPCGHNVSVSQRKTNSEGIGTTCVLYEDIQQPVQLSSQIGEVVVNLVTSKAQNVQSCTGRDGN